MSTSTHHFAHSIKESASRHASSTLREVSQKALDLASDLSYARAQKRGERLARQMRRDGSLKAKSPRKVVRLPR
jgi:hypothetical protein